MNMDKYFMWIHHERLHNHNKAKHNKTVCTFLGIYCRLSLSFTGYGRSQPARVKMKCKRTPVKNLLHLIVGLNISWNVFTVWLTPFSRDPFYSLEINANLFVYIDWLFHNWNSCTSSASHHQRIRELLLGQRPNFLQAGDPTEKHTVLLKHWYIIACQWSYSTVRKYSKPYLRTLGNNPRDTLP